MGATTVLDTTNQLYVNVDQSKIFLGENEFISGEISNAALVDVTIPAGTVLGRISTAGATFGQLKALDKDATDGSQFPVGILTEDLVIPAEDSANCTACVAGYVAEDKLVFASGESLDSVVSARTLRDRIAGDTLGVRLLSGTNLTKADNF